ncbi:16057_t:CDS:2, partial [Acaulospora morrowiae]
DEEDRHLDLFHVMMVNREFCKIAAPFLWNKFSGQPKQLITYLSCLDQISRTYLKDCDIDLEPIPIGATFDYPSFLHKFNSRSLMDMCRSYTRLLEIPVAIEKLIPMFRELSKLFIGHNNHILDLRIICYDPLMNPALDDMIAGLMLSEETNNFRNIKVFRWENLNHDSTLLFYEMSKSLRNLEEIEVFPDTICNGDAFATFIRAQRNLRRILISGEIYREFDNLTPILEALKSQENTLVCLELDKLILNPNDQRAKEGLMACKKLKSLSLSMVHGLSKSIDFTTSFTLLERFRYQHNLNPTSRGDMSHVSYELTISRILETSGVNMRFVTLHEHSPLVISTMIQHCHNVQELNINTCPLENEEICNILASLKKLRVFSFPYKENIDVNNLLLEMAQKLSSLTSSSLIAMKIFMPSGNPGKIIPDILQRFLEACRKSLVRYIWILNCPQHWDYLTERHLEVIKGSGVNFRLDLPYDNVVAQFPGKLFVEIAYMLSLYMSLSEILTSIYDLNL